QFIAENLEKRTPFYQKATIVFDAEKMLTEQDVHQISQSLAAIL
ncbi:MAG: shikimate kinase, partial [Parabacteroides sp.]|nr:shikimate kinase [Parabacteroides sp.]